MRKRVLALAVKVLSLLCALPNGIYACSGPGAGELVEHNRGIVTNHGLVALAVILATIAFYFLRQRRGLPAIICSLFFAFFHPVWYYGGGGGDCGLSMVEMAGYVSMILAGLLIIQIGLWRFRQPPLRSTGA